MTRLSRDKAHDRLRRCAECGARLARLTQTSALPASEIRGSAQPAWSRAAAISRASPPVHKWLLVPALTVPAAAVCLVVYLSSITSHPAPHSSFGVCRPSLLKTQVMHRKPADAGDPGQNSDEAGERAQAGKSAWRQGQQRHATPVVNAAAEPEQGTQQKKDWAERVPVQSFGKMTVAERDKRPGEAAAGAGQAGQMVKQAKRGKISNLAVCAVRQRQQGACREDHR